MRKLIFLIIIIIYLEDFFIGKTQNIGEYGIWVQEMHLLVYSTGLALWNGFLREELYLSFILVREPISIALTVFEKNFKDIQYLLEY